MPWTLAHPVAVLPLKWLAPRHLRLDALVVGSMMPDLGYYTGQFGVSTFAHTFTGSLVVCLPAGVALLAIFRWLRRPWIYLLPQPHRGALTPASTQSGSWNWRELAAIVLSLLLGIWTHTVWDSLTHAGAWGVEHFPILKSMVLQIGQDRLALHYLLQQISTLFGTFVLVALYLRWLRAERASSPEERFQTDAFGESRRWFVWLGCAGLAIAVASPAAWKFAGRFEGTLMVRSFLYRTAIYGTALFLPLVSCAAIILSHLRHRSSAAR